MLLLDCCKEHFLSFLLPVVISTVEEDWEWGAFLLVCHSPSP